MNYTREEIMRIGKLSEASLREDWLVMYDLLADILKSSSDMYVMIPEHLLDQIRDLIGGE